MPKRTYKVTSRTPTLGHKPDEVFEAALNRDQEERLLARGALERVKREKPEPEESKTRFYRQED